jgi:antitoxin PrlF
MDCPDDHYRGNIEGMPIARSKITAQGQVSVPAEVRRRLGAGPGSILEWDESNDQVIVRRAGRHTSADVHDALFAHAPSEKAPGHVKEGIRTYIRQKHARR